MEEDMNLDFELEYGKCFEIMKNYIYGSVVIAGYGVNARLFMGLMAELNIPILAVCDKNKVGQTYEYITPGEIKSYEYLKEIDGEYQIVIASKEYYESIKNTVLEYETKNEVVDIEKIEEIMKYIPVCHQLPEPYVYKKYLNDNIYRVNRVYANLTDDFSKKTLNQMIKTRLSWNEKYLKEVKAKDMYFISELDFKDNETFLDGGAYDGDTAIEFINKVDGKFKKIYCVEPNKLNYEKIKKLSSSYMDNKIELIPYGISDREGEVFFAGEKTGYHISTSGTKTLIKTIDSLNIKPTFIKLDIQGEELSALKGAEKTIREFKPKMAICVYHKMEDILDVTEWILNLNMEYKIFLRHHADDINDTVLYTI